ncbi:hypothetical protein C2845_PM03G32060 [Panicum miliaceum]|uniref:Uncharacterized protein n=1 Tax=Panicum miliaceum TaxID=4540 RepID=A0A3L6TCM3_PANMI|nr:hypothetical protein C2845_PM03G32060 [Panicum miliaceum]
MAGKVPAAAAAAATAAPASESVWSPCTMTDADIDALMAQGILPEKANSEWRSCTGEALPSEDRTEIVYPEAVFKDNNKRWVEEWFVVANLAPGLPPRTGFPPVLNARWEEKPTEEEMVEVEVLLAELQKLKADKLTGAALALSFPKRLTQPIQERVHPGYEYSGREDPTCGQNRKVSRGEAHRRVTLIVSGQEKVMSFWCPVPLSEGQQGKAIDPPTGLALPVADVESSSSDSSIGSESDDVVEVSGPATGAGSTMKKRRATRKVAALKAHRGGVAPRGQSSTTPIVVRWEAEAAAEKAGLTTHKPEDED